MKHLLIENLTIVVKENITLGFISLKSSKPSIMGELLRPVVCFYVDGLELFHVCIPDNSCIAPCTLPQLVFQNISFVNVLKILPYMPMPQTVLMLGIWEKFPNTFDETLHNYKCK